MSMASRTQITTPLMALHHDSKLSYKTVMEHFKAELGNECFNNPAYVSVLLRRGTDRISYLRAFSNAYKQPFSLVEELATETKRSASKKKTK